MPSDNKDKKRPTREDLKKAADAAMQAASASAAAAEVVASALETNADLEPTPAPAVARATTRNNPVAAPTKMAPARPAQVMSRDQGPQGGGHQQTQTTARTAHEEFMAALEPALRRAKATVRTEDKAGWVKIESLRNSHKVYVGKGKGTVRIESTIPADKVAGAERAGRENGRIASWLPADIKVVERAIDFLASSDERIPAPRRGQRGEELPEEQEES